MRALSRAPLRPTIGPIVLRAISVGPVRPARAAPGGARPAPPVPVVAVLRARCPRAAATVKLCRSALQSARTTHGTPARRHASGTFCFAVNFFLSDFELTPVGLTSDCLLTKKFQTFELFNYLNLG